MLDDAFRIDPRHWTQAASGSVFQLGDLENNVYLIEDIATSLAKQCRYNGNCRYFYSVAQHSVLASRVAQGKHKLAALLHDASEAYIGDIITPVKRALPGLVEYEDKLHAAIFAHFGLSFPMDPAIHEIDRRMLRTEMNLLMPHCSPAEWGFGDVEPYEGILTAPTSLWTWEQAEFEFITAFQKLTFQKVAA
jgi:hypothetical protein